MINILLNDLINKILYIVMKKGVYVYKYFSVIDGPQLPVSISKHTSTHISDRILIIGGESSGNPVNTIYIQDIENYTWSQSSVSLPNNSKYLDCINISDTEVLIVGGTDGTNIFNNVYKYDISTDTINEMNPLPTPIYGHKLVKDKYGTIYLVGGNTGTSTSNVVYKYDATNDSWTEYITLKEERYHHSADYIDSLNMILVQCGITSLGKTTSCELIDLNSNVCEYTTSMPYEVSNMMSCELDNDAILSLGGLDINNNIISDNGRIYISKTFVFGSLNDMKSEFLLYDAHATNISPGFIFVSGGILPDNTESNKTYYVKFERIY